MSDAHRFQSPVIDIIDEWLESMPERWKVGDEAETVSALDDVIASLGYGVPFDREQAAINQRLVISKANKMACMVIWGFYHDHKISEVSVLRHYAA